MAPVSPCLTRQTVIVLGRRADPSPVQRPSPVVPGLGAFSVPRPGRSDRANGQTVPGINLPKITGSTGTSTEASRSASRETKPTAAVDTTHNSGVIDQEIEKSKYLARPDCDP
jgi:hypothetical protein